jgi:monoamine oxidase
VTALVDDRETRRVEGGNQLVAERLAERLEHVHLNETVNAVTDTATAVVVTTAQGEVEASACIVAVPAHTVRELALTPPPPPSYSTVRMATAAKLAVSLTEPRAPDAVMSVPGRWWAYTTRSDGRGGRTLGAWAGAAPVVDLVGARGGAGRWLDLVTELWPGLPVDRDSAVVTLWDERAYSVLPHDPDASFDGCGRVVFAGEHTAGDWTATMEGALRSGERAAHSILSRSQR